MSLLPSKNSLAVFTVSAACGGTGGQTPAQRLCHEVRQVVRQCTLPDLDVVLPHTSGKAPEGDCFIVAVADKAGAEVLAKRLRDQLQRWEQGQQTGITFSVSYKFLDLSARPPMGDNDLLQIVSGKLEQLLKKEPLMKGRAGGDRGHG